MSKTRKYYLAFIAYALGMMLIWLIEYKSSGTFAPYKLIFPLLFMLPAYAFLLFCISKEKKQD